jgi:hypothetical protein
MSNLSEEKQFALACRLHSEAIYCYNWLCGPYRDRGLEGDDVQSRSSRRTAEYNMRHRGWTHDQLCQWFAQPEKLPRKTPKHNTGGGRLGSQDGGWEAVTETLERLGRRYQRPDPAPADVAKKHVAKIRASLGYDPGIPGPRPAVEETPW